MIEELQTRYDTRASFYGKAHIITHKNDIEQVQELKSYNTIVARCITNFVDGIILYQYLGNYSQTTTRHQKEFFRQLGLSDKEIKKLFKEGVLSYEL